MNDKLEKIFDRVNEKQIREPEEGQDFDYSNFTPSKEPPLSNPDYADNDEWEEVKQSGETHYKTGGIEPIDFYKAGGILKPFAIACIIKYAFRNRNKLIVEKDIDKIIHYAQMLRVLCHEGE